MPRPPVIGEYTPQVPVEEGMRRVIPEVSGASVAPELGEFGASLQRVATSEAANYTASALSQAQGQWVQQLQKSQESAAPGAPNFTPTFMQQYADYSKEAVKNAPNSLAARMLQQHLGEFGQQLQTRAMAFESQARTDHNVDVSKQSVDAAGNELMLDPSVFNQRLAQRSYLIDSMNLDPQTKEKLQTYAHTEMARYATLGAIQKDPYAAELELHSDKPGQPYTQYLTPELKQQMSQEADRVFRERVSDAERLHTMTVQQQKDQQDGILKQGLEMSESGQLSAGWINQHADILDHEQMKFLLDEARGKQDHVQSNLHVYSDLLTSANDGQDVRDDAQRALFNGQLSKDDYTRIVGASGKDKQPWVKQGFDYISTALKPSQMDPDPSRPLSLANAQNEWQDWISDHPKATPKDAESEYQGIVKRYQLVDTSKTMLTLPVPQYLVGSRTQPDIAATETATVKAFQSGQISQDEFYRQAALLQQWGAIAKPQKKDNAGSGK